LIENLCQYRTQPLLSKLIQAIEGETNVPQDCPNHTRTRGFWVSYDVCMKQMLTTKSLDAMHPATSKRYEVRDQNLADKNRETMATLEEENRRRAESVKPSQKSVKPDRNEDQS